MTREEAIERIKSRYDKWALDDKDLEAIQCTFPELMESEDERIIRFLINLLSSGTWKEEWPFGPNECVAWLEKQKEQKDYNKLYEDIAKSEWFKKAYEGKSLGCDYEQKEQDNMKYIDADKLRALIDEKWRKLADENVKVGGGKWDAEISTCLSVIRLIDSLQQEPPEVDIEKIIEQTYHDGSVADTDDMAHVDYENIARYFYELGLNARKEE